jgi:DNA-binding CsgD family transcriptional regulator
LTGSGEEKSRNRRDYRPTLEAAEALRLLSSASAGALFPGLAAEHELQAAPGQSARTPVDDFVAVSNATWDAALVQAQVAEISSAVGPTAANAARTTTSTGDPTAHSSGLTQLNKYLGRAWYRTGVPVQMHEDSSQAVFTTLLQRLGRQRFEALVSDVGCSGIKDVLSRETNEGADFFRAVDMVKKRAHRERVFLPLDVADVPESSDHTESRARREALREAIDHSLSCREASLINDTLMGKTPAEIALHWSVTPKTVSNEKTRVIQKLREALLAREAD